MYRLLDSEEKSDEISRWNVEDWYLSIAAMWKSSCWHTTMDLKTAKDSQQKVKQQAIVAQEAFAQACGFSVSNRKSNKVRNKITSHTGAVLEGERSFRWRCFFHMEAESVSKSIGAILRTGIWWYIFPGLGWCYLVKPQILLHPSIAVTWWWLDPLCLCCSSFIYGHLRGHSLANGFAGTEAEGRGSKRAGTEGCLLSSRYISI